MAQRTHRTPRDLEERDITQNPHGNEDAIIAWKLAKKSTEITPVFEHICGLFCVHRSCVMTSRRSVVLCYDHQQGLPERDLRHNLGILLGLFTAPARTRRRESYSKPVGIIVVVFKYQIVLDFIFTDMRRNKKNLLKLFIQKHHLENGKEKNPDRACHVSSS